MLQVTGETRETLPFVNGLPLCHDPLYPTGVLGNMYHDEVWERYSRSPDLQPDSSKYKI